MCEKHPASNLELRLDLLIVRGLSNYLSHHFIQSSHSAAGNDIGMKEKPQAHDMILQEISNAQDYSCVSLALE